MGSYNHIPHTTKYILEEGEIWSVLLCAVLLVGPLCVYMEDHRCTCTAVLYGYKHMTCALSMPLSAGLAV